MCAAMQQRIDAVQRLASCSVSGRETISAQKRNGTNGQNVAEHMVPIQASYIFYASLSNMSFNLFFFFDACLKLYM